METVIDTLRLDELSEVERVVSLCRSACTGIHTIYFLVPKKKRFLNIFQSRRSQLKLELTFVVVTNCKNSAGKLLRTWPRLYQSNSFKAHLIILSKFEFREMYGNVERFTQKVVDGKPLYLDTNCPSLMRKTADLITFTVPQPNN